MFRHFWESMASRTNPSGVSHFFKGFVGLQQKKGGVISEEFPVLGGMDWFNQFWGSAPVHVPGKLGSFRLAFLRFSTCLVGLCTQTRVYWPSSMGFGGYRLFFGVPKGAAARHPAPWTGVHTHPVQGTTGAVAPSTRGGRQHVPGACGVRRGCGHAV